MRLVELKEDDERFGYKAGDLFIVEDANYDNDKYVGVKVIIQKIDNSFYKDQMRNWLWGPGMRKVAKKLMGESND